MRFKNLAFPSQNQLSILRKKYEYDFNKLTWFILQALKHCNQMNFSIIISSQYQH